MKFSRYLHIFICWIFGGAAGVADFCTKYTFGSTKKSVCTPETAHAKYCRFIFNFNLMQQIWAFNWIILKKKTKTKNCFIIMDEMNSFTINNEKNFQNLKKKKWFREKKTLTIVIPTMVICFLLFCLSLEI